MKYKKLVIDRKIWYRGKGSENSALVATTHNKMCCLGFLGTSCGFKKKDMLHIDTPANLSYKLGVSIAKWPDGVVNELGTFAANSKWTTQAMKINDNGEISDKMREAELKKHFKQIGYLISFIN